MTTIDQDEFNEISSNGITRRGIRQNPNCMGEQICLSGFGNVAENERITFQELIQLKSFTNMYEAATFSLFQTFETEYDILFGAINHSFRYSSVLAEIYPFSCLFSVFYIFSMLLRYFSAR